MKRRILALLLTASMAATLLPATACAAATESYSASAATLIKFTDAGATASGAYSGYEIDGTAVKLTAAGTYVFSGSCGNGSITVAKETEGITVVLNGLTLSSTTTSPITINKDADATLHVAAGSKNTVSDGTVNDESAAVKVKSGAALAIDGTGTLTVDGNSKNGIKGAANAAITVAETALTIDAVDNGLACDNSLSIASGTLAITAGGDAIKAEPDGDDTTSAGAVTISGGTITVQAACDAVQANTVTVSGGTFDLTTNEGHTTTLTDESDSCKALKAADKLTITGGTFTIDAADDALHSNGDVSVTGGTFTIETGDDSMHADNALTLGTENGGTQPSVNITSSYEGLEGTTVSIYSGDISVTAADDGINAANSDIGERSDLYEINVYGGAVLVMAGADGLDSNHDINLYGGTVEAYGATRGGGEAALDLDGTFTLSGGTLLGSGSTPTAGTQPYITAGTTGMSMGGGGRGGMTAMDGMPSDMPTDGTMPTDEMMHGNRPADGEMPTGENGTFTRPDGENGTFTKPDGTTGTFTRPDGGDKGGMTGTMGGEDTTTSGLAINAGDTITVTDASGKTIFTTKAKKAMSNVVFSSEALTTGSTYTISVNGSEIGESTAALGTGGAASGSMGGMGTKPTAGQSGFTDVTDGDWFAGAVSFVKQSGLMTGTADTTFSPSTGMTRGMLVAVLYRMAGSPAQTGSATFTDVAQSDYYAAAVKWAQDNGIVSFISGSSFAPSQEVTREELAAMLYAYADNSGADTGKTDDLSSFADAGTVSGFAKTALQWACGAGVVNGSNGSLHPTDGATRAEVATMLMRFASVTKNA